VRGDICAPCCGAEREVTVDCPLDCEYLRESRKHDKPQPPLGDLPNRDIHVTEEFLEEHRGLLTFVSGAVLRAASETPGVVDFDVREALEALIRTYRTLQSGVYYDSLPSNPLAGAIYSAVRMAGDEYRKQEQQHLGMSRTRDTDVLGLLVFLQHFELASNNGRRRGRAFLEMLHGVYAGAVAAEEPRKVSSLVLP
jgi:hypothetical protein